MYMSGYGMGGMWLWWLLPLLLIVVLFYVLSTRKEGGGRSRAQDILDERLVKGEIDLETYEKLKDALDEERE